MKDWLSNQNKRKTVASLISYHSFNVFFSITNMCLPSLLVFTSLLRITFAVLQKPCQGNFGKFQGSGESRFSGFKIDRYSLKIPKWHHRLVWDYKRGKLVSSFLNNAAKTSLYGLEFSENIQIEHVFQSKAFFHLNSNLHTSWLSAFKLLFFTINLNFVISNKTSTYRKLRLPLTSNISLVFLPLKMQKRLKQIKTYGTYFYYGKKKKRPKKL